MTIFTAPHGQSLAQTRAARLVRWVGLAVAASSAAGLVALSAPTEARAAADDAAVTVAWSGQTGDLAQYQPDRDPASRHYGDFKDVGVTVSRTEDLVDEAVSVTVTGMPGATRQLADSSSGDAVFGASFVQAMQCWGDPADPGFYQNCQWGAMEFAGATAAPNLPNTPGTLGAGRSGVASYDVPFRAVTGATYSSLLAGPNGADTELLQVMSPQSTNERTVLVDTTGTSRFEFEVQSAASQPYLGCGNESSATGTRCWLVVVPRGVHTSADAPSCFVGSPWNSESAGVIQEDSPINPNCEYWANRVVVPLDFRPTGSVCAAGSVEQRVVGTDSIVAAFSSWQTALCRQAGTAYSLTTSADQLAREQLLNGQAQMAITPRPLTAQTLPSTVDPDQLAETDLVYAPVAVSGVVIAFLQVKNGQVQTEMNLSPRLIAKLLTQSYAEESGLFHYYVDQVSGPWRTNPWWLAQDPEFKALNPGAIGERGQTIVLTGPNASDAIALLWAYVQADDKARAFLAGDPDNVLPGDEGNSGMTLNPYYLPKGHPDAKVPAFYEGMARSAEVGKDVETLLPTRVGGDVQWREVGLTYDDGTPKCLCDAEVSTFLKAEETLLPQQRVSGDQLRYDILQARPYAANVEAAAKMLFRADSGSKTHWDQSKANGPGLPTGGYISDGLSSRTNVFLNGYTDLASAARYRLSTASLQVPNAPGVYVDGNEAGMSAALAAQTSTTVAGVTVTDPATLPAEAYPLTSVLYAAVNLSTTDEAARERYADLIEFAVTDGQVPGHSIGELPEGYLPLTEDLRDQALAAVERIRAYVPDSEPTPTRTQKVTSPAPGAGAVGAAPVSAGGAVVPSTGVGGVPRAGESGKAPQTGYAQDAVTSDTTTPGTASAADGVLGGTLLTGLAGAIAGPFLLRRRGAL